ncbi:hypothetical protein LTR78_008790 [Recurvomyces mirabilis]|uniref:Heterokaryon incompatibility domain-containing protein n=1 Tax=Recurvomyces mirabilis TaxID=574656 RepID=A0AAE0TPJ9_9PEZI|nr:hypothetical protein LTR78_008790 [Recurvomyces mirabilis]KAK5160972.1 hypothetical protein LTS14_000766 [Recurvomyces mirabilis]
MKRMTGYISLARDRYGGRVYPDPKEPQRTRIQYHPSKYDQAHILEGVIHLAELLYVEGAREIFTCNPQLEYFVRPTSDPVAKVNVAGINSPSLNDSEFQAWLTKLRKIGLTSPDTPFASAHQMGSCRMGTLPSNSVVDPKGRVWGTKGLYVCDASVLPSASGVNPMITTMGISRGIARGIAEDAGAVQQVKRRGRFITTSPKRHAAAQYHDLEAAGVLPAASVCDTDTSMERRRRSYEDFILARRDLDQLPSYLVEEAAEIRERRGYRKIIDFAAKAKEHLHWGTGTPFEWCWLDTCCIDKRSSSELSEDINSMWKWYNNCGFCVVYLEDVSSSQVMLQSGEYLKDCSWFGRGWTLQELLAPQKLSFFDKEWVALLSVYKAAHHEEGTHWCWWSKDGYSAAKTLATAARIPESMLARGRIDVSDACVAQKMSWAAHRRATRDEDVAYSLLSLLGINMPLLYGEGSRAFLRLQQEILRYIDDSSIFAWQLTDDEPTLVRTACPHYLCESTSLLASSPLLFQDAGMINKDSRSAFRIHTTNSAVYVDVEAPVRRIVQSMDRVRGISDRIPWYVLELGYYMDDTATSRTRAPCRIILWRDSSNGSETETYMAGRLSCCTSAFEKIDLGGRQEEITDSIERRMRFRIPIGYDDDQLDGLNTGSRQLGCANAKPPKQDVADVNSIADTSARPMRGTAIVISETAPSISSFTVSACSVDIAALKVPIEEEPATPDRPRSLFRNPWQSVTAIERLRGLVGIGTKRLG